MKKLIILVGIVAGLCARANEFPFTDADPILPGVYWQAGNSHYDYWGVIMEQAFDDVLAQYTVDSTVVISCGAIGTPDSIEGGITVWLAVNTCLVALLLGSQLWQACLLASKQ